MAVLISDQVSGETQGRATCIGITPMTLVIAFFGACLAAGQPDCGLDFYIRMVVAPQLIAGLIALGVAALAPVVLKRYRLRRAAAAPHRTRHPCRR